jgi:hypothetical protein
MKKMTNTPLLPELISAVQEFGTVHYKQVTDVLVNRGVWGDQTPNTPHLTVNNYLTTSTDSSGNKVFERIEAGVYRLAAYPETPSRRLVSFFRRIFPRFA